VGRSGAWSSGRPAASTVDAWSSEAAEMRQMNESEKKGQATG
jgi:hypothetical protein